MRARARARDRTDNSHETTIHRLCIKSLDIDICVCMRVRIIRFIFPPVPGRLPLRKTGDEGSWIDY